LEGVVAKRKSGTYTTVSDWLKIKNSNYTQSERYESFDAFKAKQQTERDLPPLTKKPLPPIPKKPPLRAVPVQRKTARKLRRRSEAN
jgi:ATP-dependent DNA ligase